MTSMRSSVDGTGVRRSFRRSLLLAELVLSVLTALTLPQASRAAIFVTYRYDPDADAVLVYHDNKFTSAVKCPREKPNDTSDPGYFVWETCVDGRIREFTQFAKGSGGRYPPSPAGNSKPSLSATTASKIAPAAVTSSGTGPLASTPYLPFEGNRLAIVALVPDANTFDATTALYDVALRRQSDCSLREDFLFTAVPQLTNQYIGSFDNVQNDFHALAGLTTTANRFTNGCDDPLRGLPETSQLGIKGIQLLGTTPTGASISATFDDNGNLQITVADSVAKTQTTSTLISGTGNPLMAFVTADLNGDGFLDLVVSHVVNPNTSQPSTEMLLGNGNGTFKSGVFLTPTGAVTVDDFNGDGKLDIAVLGTSVVVMLGAGDGTFTAGPTTGTALTGVMMGGDFNGDGKRDLLIGGNVLLGNGGGGFSAGPATSGIDSYLLGIAGTVAVGDFDNDGRSDVAIASSGFVSIYLGKGDGTFKAGERYAALPDAKQISVTDIDGDDIPDLILGTSTSGVYTAGGGDSQIPMLQLLMGRGDGTFADAPMIGGHYDPLISGPQIASADFLGNGKLSLLTTAQLLTSSSTTLQLQLTSVDGTGQLTTPVTSSINNSSFSTAMVAASDIDGDGKPDTVLAGSALAILFNQGGGAFGAEQDYALASRAVSLVVGDFNGDGHRDVAVGVAPPNGQAGTSGVFVFLGQAGGTLLAPVKIDASVNPAALASGDLDGDGRTDLVVGDEGTGPTRTVGLLHVYLGKSDGTFTTVAAPTTAATFYTNVAIGDMNGDGKPDLVVTGTTGTTIGALTPTLYTLTGRGDGTFATALVQALQGQDGIGPNSIALADFDHDGKLDVAVGNSNDFSEVMLGQGDGTYSPTLLALAQRPTTLAAADLTGDGYAELLVGNDTGLLVFKNQADWAVSTSAGAATTVALSASPNPATTGQSVTLSATVAVTAAGTPSGSVTFSDGSTSLGTQTLSAQGTASLSIATLAAGTHAVTARYGGDATFAASSSSAVQLVINAAPDFAIAADPGSGSVASGASATVGLTITPTGGFTGSVDLSCSGLPAAATCSFSPASVDVTSGAATSTLTIGTQLRSASLSLRRPDLPLLALIFAPLLIRRRQCHPTNRSRRLAGPQLGFIALCGMMMASCGGGGSHNAGPPSATGTPAGSYTITVTATSGSTSRTVNYTLTVT